MDHRKLRYFCSVAEERSLHRAAEKLRISQPALTRAIKELEAELGASLFVRHSRGVDLTHQGEVLRERAIEILRQAEDARSAVAAAGSKPRGLVCVGVPPTLSVLLLAPAAREIAANWPEIRLNFHERLMPELLAMLQSDKLDMAIVGNPPPHAGVAYEPLVREDVYLVAGADQILPPLSELEQLSNYALIVSGSGVGSFSWFEEAVEAGSIISSIRFRVESPALSLSLVRAGLGMAVLPRSALIDCVDDPELRLSRIQGLTLARSFATSTTRPATRATLIAASIIKDEVTRLNAEGVFSEPR